MCLLKAFKRIRLIKPLKSLPDYILSLIIRSQPLSNSFHNSLDIESAALVERLLSDLVKTSEGFQTLKRQNEDLRNNLLKEKQLVRKLSTNLLAGTIKEGK